MRVHDKQGRLLSLAVVGMAGYGLYSAALGVYEALLGRQLPLWASLGLVVAGLLLLAATVLVRLQVPGGLALALGALFALQALALSNDTDWYGRIVVLSQIARGLFAATLGILAFVGGLRAR